MKKVLLSIFVIAVFAVSCSKENKLNRRLDGEWNVTTLGGTALPSGSSMTFKFEKDKKGKGSYTSVFSDGTTTETTTGTYDLEEDTKIYTTDSDGEKDTLVVVSYDKTSLKLTDVAGTTASTMEATKK